jgi:hypothetical protein
MLSACSCEEQVSAERAPVEELLRDDRRLVELLQGCTRSEFYDRDLSDLVPVLVAKLERGRPDPLKRAKEELGELGLRAMPELERAFHATFTDPSRSAVLENVIDALAFNPTDESHELQIGALQHPQESVRAKALDGLQRSVRPADFDLLLSRLDIETPEVRRQSVAVLFAADRGRAEDALLGFMERGEARDLWPNAAAELATPASGESARRCATLFGGLDEKLSAFLAAGAARYGHAPCLEYLRAQLASTEGQRRLTAVHALDRAGLLDELGPVLQRDGAAELRAIAASALAREPLDDARRELLRGALDDPDETVQSAALAGLCSRDDEQGLARAMAQLEGHAGQLQSALLALREPLRRRPELVRAAYERLMSRHALEEHRPISQRTATFKAIGQLPLAEAAEFLRQIGIAAGEERIESLRAHDWLMIQASNTDVPGRAWLAEALRTETDPLQRLDLLDAIGSVRDELARQELLAVAEQPESAPLERLFVAHALIKIGPSWEIAPRLKRVAFSMQTPAEAEARKSLQCLLWHWY